MMMIVRAFRATLDPRPDASGAGRELCIQPETHDADPSGPRPRRYRAAHRPARAEARPAHRGGEEHTHTIHLPL